MPELERLKDIVAKLRGPGGCPWDIEQTMDSIIPHIIEEAYELIDSIQSNKLTDIKEELGDVLLHVVMIAQMADEKKHFNLDDIAKNVADKMVRRHPHVFGTAKAESVDEVWDNWDKIKKTEKTETRTFDSIPKSLPALLQAQKLQKKAAREGFDWPDINGPIDKIEEELNEFKHELEQKETDQNRLEEEFGDLLFALVNVGRKLGINSEESMRNSNLRFWERFYLMEDILRDKGKECKNCDLEVLDSYWEKAKQEIKKRQ